MIVWLNGPFGGGKSILSAALAGALDGAVVADPEEVGDLLRRPLGGHRLLTRDYQELPPWREVTLALVTGLARYTGGPVLVPMSVLDRARTERLLGSLRASGLSVHHLILHTAPEVLHQRIADSCKFPGDEPRSGAVRAYRRRRAADYFTAAATWMHASGHVIDTTALSPEQTLRLTLTHLAHATST
ncbi:AAA family ATPase [[Kitasatospora] papulosa]|uniref:AAA family ATPase n=1 Tax=[Kitasatospora] papulosa TaxID=1464011 RepID=UPI003818D352